MTQTTMTTESFGRADRIASYLSSSASTWANDYFSTDKTIREEKFFEVLNFRQALGRPFPFAKQDALGRLSDYYVSNPVLLTRADECLKSGMGTYHTRAILFHPEGRHQCLYRCLQEVLSCMHLLGIDADREYVFSLIMGFKTPKNDLDFLFSRMAGVLINSPTEPMTPSGLVALYDELLDGLSLGVASQLDSPFDTEERDKILEQVCSYVQNVAEGEDSPIIKALLAAESVRKMKPFQTINMIMARLVFSWVANNQGIPVASYSPFVTFLHQWMKNDKDTKGYQPLLPEKRSIVHTDTFGSDWSAYLEELLGFFVEDLHHFNTRLMRLAMKRERVEHLISLDSELNERQNTLLAELLLHADAEFTYASVMEQFGVSYATAYADLGKLEERGYASATLLQKATIFIASNNCREVYHQTSRQIAPKEYFIYYGENGELNEDYRHEQFRTLRAFNQSLPSHGGYVQPLPPHLLPQRSLAILQEGDGKARGDHRTRI